MKASKKSTADMIGDALMVNIKADLLRNPRGVKKYIKDAILNRGYMIKYLRSVLEQGFPQHLEYFEKLMVLK